MDGFDPAAAFGPDIASRYDEHPRGDEQAAVDLLSAHACGRALEFAIGTGRIARPLSARGVQVDGIELSPHMIARLRETAGARMGVHHGDMSRVRTGRTYPLVYLVFNTIFNLLTQDDQVRCFENAAAHLEPGGVFVVEAAVPSAWLRGRTNYVDAEGVDADSATLDVCRFDPVTQVLSENHVRLDAGGIHLFPIACRLAWPGELDLMARLAGLRLLHRFGDWDRRAYTGDDLHVSVYGA